MPLVPDDSQNYPPKTALINWHELLEHCLLDDSVYDGRNAKLTSPSVRLRNFHSSDWKRGIFSLPDFLYQLVVVFLQPQQCRFDCHSIDSRRSLVRLHSSVSSVQVVLFRILPGMSGSALSLSFHIRLNERCALTYPLRSALSLCEQLSLFSAPIAHSSFPCRTKDSY